MTILDPKTGKTVTIDTRSRRGAGSALFPLPEPRPPARGERAKPGQGKAKEPAPR